jgi:hypothetical protein
MDELIPVGRGDDDDEDGDEADGMRVRTPALA